MVDLAPGSQGRAPPNDQILMMQSHMSGKELRKSRMSDGGSVQAHIINRSKVIVDKDASTAKMDNFNENIQNTVTDAINFVEGHATIKVTSNLYEEKIEITKPGIEIRPKEKGGEVTI